MRKDGKFVIEIVNSALAERTLEDVRKESAKNHASKPQKNGVHSESLVEEGRRRGTSSAFQENNAYAEARFEGEGEDEEEELDPFSLLDRRAVEGELLARVRSKKKHCFELSLEQKLSLAKAGLQQFENGDAGVPAVNGKEDLRALFDNYSSCALEWTEDNQIKNDYEFVHKRQQKEWAVGEEDIVRFGFIINDGEKLSLSADYNTEDFSHLDLMYLLKLCAYENSFCGFKETPAKARAGPVYATDKQAKVVAGKEQSVSLLGKEVNSISPEHV